jgi:hypothetical protein
MLVDELQNKRPSIVKDQDSDTMGMITIIQAPSILEEGAGDKNGLVNIERFVQRLRMTAH